MRVAGTADGGGTGTEGSPVVSDRHPVSPVGLHRVLEPQGVLPQAAWKLDPSPELGAGEIRVRVQRLNLDAASFRQLSDKHHGDGGRVRAEVLDIVRTRGKMQNPVTGSGGMLVGVVEAIGPNSHHHELEVGDPVTTLVSLTLTPLQIDDDLRDWDGLTEQVPVRRARHPLRPHDRREGAVRSQQHARDGRHGRVRSAGAHRPRRTPLRRRGSPADRRRHRRRGQERFALARGGASRAGASAPSASCPS